MNCTKKITITSVERITPKRTARLDLHQLRKAAGQDLQAILAATDSEVSPE